MDERICLIRLLLPPADLVPGGTMEPGSDKTSLGVGVAAVEGVALAAALVALDKAPVLAVWMSILLAVLI